ncbi:MAG: DUF1326 domain-containing protein [Planctomycetota bacterium]|nr:DUF1326 domain-containing protein [Planctomycetota bacterium]
MYRNILTCLALCILCTASRLHAEPIIYGSYIEVRSDSKTAGLPRGPGFGLPSKASANRTAGSHRAILFWEIVKGSWNGQELDSLKIVTVVESSGPLRSPQEGKLRTVIYLDEKASEEKAQALLDLARELAPRYLKKLVRIRKAPIEFSRKDHDLKLAIRNHLEVRIETHEHESDICESICGKDPQPGRSLSLHVQSEKALGRKNLYRAEDLQVRWTSKKAESCLTGQFGL